MRNDLLGSRQVRESVGPYAVVAFAAAFGGHQLSNFIYRSPAHADVLRAEKIELVTSDGEVCIVLESNDGGGLISIRNPKIRQSDVEDGTILAIGSTLPGISQMVLTDPRGLSDESLSFTVGGKPCKATISGGGKNKAGFRLGSGSSGDDAVFVLRDGEGEVTLRH